VVDLQAFAFAFSRQVREMSAGTPWIPGIGAGVAVVQIACLVMLWRGRKAGLYGYVALALIYAGVFSVAVGPAGLCSLAPAALVVAAAVWNWERLR
jgi:multidrug transporter EmrE-like cation transporter